jgi:uncharacterized DUF497 family protein
VNPEARKEKSSVALGLADGIPLTEVFTDRVASDVSVVRRVISARVSNREERRRYAQRLEVIRSPDHPDAGPG